MGLLNSNSLNDYITKTIPANARSIWQGVKRIPQDLRQLTDPAFMQGLLSQPRKPLDPNEMAAMGMDYVQPMGGLLAHTVYHGSPHKFDKFDMSKIGTGEGAQAYGHGLYFAESPGVARSYADRLQRPNADALAKYQSDWDALQPQIDDAYKRMNMVTDTKAMKQGESDYLALQGIRDDIHKKIVDESPSNFYKVDIPDESIPRMLDWDKPLSEQAPEVRKVLEDKFHLRASTDGHLTGEEINNYISSLTQGGGGPFAKYQSSNAQSSGRQAMIDAGIPGIRYLDGMSRGQGGTSNFVLFDDQLPRILEVNGQPTGLLSYADEANKAKKVKK